MACTNPASGLPSVLEKLCSVVSVPLGVILKTVPQYWLAPPSGVVPYKFPSVACIKSVDGLSPSVPVKICRVVRVPSWVIL